MVRFAGFHIDRRGKWKHPFQHRQGRVLELLSDIATAPTRAVPELAKFGGALVNTFATDLGVYGGHALRPLGSMLLMETASALSGLSVTAEQTAMLSIAVLKEKRTFDIA